MTEPTDVQIHEYANKLPEVYRCILSSFPATNSRRRYGSGLTLGTIDTYLKSNYRPYVESDTEIALGQLVERDFLEEASEPIPYYTPTALGERLIMAITGVVPVPQTVPNLPELTWA